MNIGIIKQHSFAYKQKKQKHKMNIILLENEIEALRKLDADEAKEYIAQLESVNEDSPNYTNIINLEMMYRADIDVEDLFIKDFEKLYVAMYGTDSTFKLLVK